MFYDYINDNETPFQPGTTVSPSKFKGRHHIIKKIIRYAPSVKKGNIQQFFLTGNKGMGKTSLAKYVASIMKKQYNMTTVYVSNNDNNTVDGFIDLIIKGLSSHISKNIVKEKLESLFGGIESFEYKGAKVNFKTSELLKEDLRLNFHFYLKKLIDEINSNGVFLIIDDINALSESKDFVKWYKKFTDTVDMNDSDLKLYILFAGYPEKYDNLLEQDMSFGRIFQFEELGLLDDKDITDFFIDTFASVNMQCEDKVLESFTYYSQGLPLVMQQIGDSAFWLTDSNILSKDIVKQTLYDTADAIAKRQLRHVLNRIPQVYYDILLKITDSNLTKFTKTDLKKLSVNDELLNKFINDMIELNVLKILYDDYYMFSNHLYYAYFLIQNAL